VKFAFICIEVVAVVVAVVVVVVVEVVVEVEAVVVVDVVGASKIVALLILLGFILISTRKVKASDFTLTLTTFFTLGKAGEHRTSEALRFTFCRECKSVSLQVNLVLWTFILTFGMTLCIFDPIFLLNSLLPYSSSFSLTGQSVALDEGQKEASNGQSLV